MGGFGRLQHNHVVKHHNSTHLQTEMTTFRCYNRSNLYSKDSSATASLKSIVWQLVIRVSVIFTSALFTRTVIFSPFLSSSDSGFLSAYTNLVGRDCTSPPNHWPTPHHGDTVKQNVYLSLRSSHTLAVYILKSASSLAHNIASFILSSLFSVSSPSFSQINLFSIIFFPSPSSFFPLSIS